MDWITKQVDNAWSKLTPRNTHVNNRTNWDVVAQLLDNDMRETKVYLAPREIKCIPTCHGKITLRCHVENDPNNNASYTDEANRSFILGMNKNRLEILRAKMGTVDVVDESMRNPQIIFTS